MTSMMQINNFPSGDIQVGVKDQRNLEKRKVVIFGSGDLGRALLTCFVKAGYTVIIASRDPMRKKDHIESLGGKVLDYETALNQSDLIVMAIPFEAIFSLPVDLFKSKIIIDVTNKSLKYSGRKESLAVQLQEFLPNSSVVKAFNTLSAYVLQNNAVDCNKEIPVCSNDKRAKKIVMSFTHDLGYHPIDAGTLANTKSIENIPLVFFPMWKIPIILASCAFILGFLIMLFRHQLCDNFASDTWNWKSFNSLLLVNTHNAFAVTSITLLSCCYFPGVLAAYIQLHRGSKYTQFPNFLNQWMKCRKQMGLLTFSLSTTHAVMGVAQLCNKGYASDWHHFSYLACGSLALGVMGILAASSIPSVSSSLSWREFAFIQSKLGWTCLILSLLHLIFKKWSSLLTNTIKCHFIPDPGQIFIILPLLTVILKLPLLLPCVDSHLQKIRRGYERSNPSKNVQYQLV